MKTTNYNKSEILKEAWVMFREYEMEVPFSVCLKNSWNMAKGIVTNGVTKNTDVKLLKEIIYMNTNSTDWMFILHEVQNNSKGFQKDIATKALNGMNISEKQAWCVAFEFKNIA